ncbi:uncharacterized protein FA14DRAFT_181133 [Meira miltonrushii]|uniref:Uncharacterized protein n=1 Tax=Meira miltonrushii TaxID=1280837 RepID=A0A316V5B0_9BASI|nr:uncharacterized protein FA14DRAFT_181133 [Meira miltonrushii]PWN32444.1 hypothetical protein FA14DRAFT_181133 [Meira miltonrushii]
MYRSSSYRRPQSPRGTREVHDGEIVENPNSYGMFGRYEDAPQAMVSNDQTYQSYSSGRHNSITSQRRPSTRMTTNPNIRRMPSVRETHSAFQQNNQAWANEEVAPEDDPNSPPTHPPHSGHSHFHLPTRHHPSASASTARTEYQDTESFGQEYVRNETDQQPHQNYTFGHTLEKIESGYTDSISTLRQGATGRTSQVRNSDDTHTPLVSSPHVHEPHAHFATAPQSLQDQSNQRRPSEGNYLNTFDAVHGNDGHLAQSGAQIPIGWQHLFKRPLIRQWVFQNKVYQEVDDRSPSQFELFFDLVMVGIIHKLADGAAEAPTGLNVAKFVLCFYPAWSVWSDLRSYMNVSGTDDVWQRMYTLLVMCLLVGYAANATGIRIEKQVHAGDADDGQFHHGVTETVQTEEQAVSHARRAIVSAVGVLGANLVKRSSDGGEHIPLKLVRQIGSTDYWFAEGWHSAIAAAFGFYMVAKCCRLALFIIYGMLLPKFRKALFLHAISFLVITLIYLPIMFLDRPGLIVILICVGVVAELAIRYVVAALLQIMHGRSKHKGHTTYMPAYAITHLMERTTLFTILVLGETVMSSTFIAQPDEYGPRPQYWRAALSITIAFMLMWLYFDVDSSRTFVHGLRRNWFTSITYTHLHFPLCASLILMSSTLSTMIHEEAVDQNFLWFFSASISIAMLCMAILGTLHKSLDRWGSSIVPKSARIASRFIIAAIFGVMPLLHHWTSAEFLGVHAIILGAAVAFETFGKIGAVGRVYDHARAEELRLQRLAMHSSSPITEKNGEGGEFPMNELQHQQSRGDPSRMQDLIKSPSHVSSGMGEKHSPFAGSQRHLSMMVDSSMRRLNKDSMVKGPNRRASWHEYDDLTGDEMGEMDCGIESELGHLRSKEVASGQRWAYVAS